MHVCLFSQTLGWVFVLALGGEVAKNVVTLLGGACPAKTEATTANALSNKRECELRYSYRVNKAQSKSLRSEIQIINSNLFGAVRCTVYNPNFKVIIGKSQNSFFVSEQEKKTLDYYSSKNPKNKSACGDVFFLSFMDDEKPPSVVKN